MKAYEWNAFISLSLDQRETYTVLADCSSAFSGSSPTFFLERNSESRRGTLTWDRLTAKWRSLPVQHAGWDLTTPRSFFRMAHVWSWVILTVLRFTRQLPVSKHLVESLGSAWT